MTLGDNAFQNHIHLNEIALNKSTRDADTIPLSQCDLDCSRMDSLPNVTL